MNWGAFAQVFIDGVRFATLNFVGLGGLIVAGYWVARSTPRLKHRLLVFSLPAVWLMALLEIASIQLAPNFFQKVLGMPVLLTPFVQIGANYTVLVMTAGEKAQFFWGVLNFVFACLAVLYLGGFM